MDATNPTVNDVDEGANPAGLAPAGASGLAPAGASGLAPAGASGLAPAGSARAPGPAPASAREPESAVKRDTESGAPARGNVHPRSTGKRDTEPNAAQPSNVCPREIGPRGLAGQQARAAEATARIAGAQQGSVRRSQLIAAGVSRHSIDRRTKTGDLHRIHRGVYIAGHLALAPMAREAAALLACGPDAIVSHQSAAYLWSLVEHAPPEVHVTLVGRRCRPKAGVRTRTVAEFDRLDLRRKRQIPLTSPARTVIDFAAGAGHDELEGVISEARARGLLREGELEAALDRAGPRAGVATVRAFLAFEHGPGFTRSEAERRMRRLARAARLPPPVANTRVEGWEVDFFWPAQRLVLEVDGYGVHGHRAAFERDRRKGLALVAAGYRVIRITWIQLVREPVLVAAQLARALAVGG